MKQFRSRFVITLRLALLSFCAALMVSMVYLFDYTRFFGYVEGLQFALIIVPAVAGLLVGLSAETATQKMAVGITSPALALFIFYAVSLLPVELGLFTQQLAANDYTLLVIQQGFIRFPIYLIIMLITSMITTFFGS